MVARALIRPDLAYPHLPTSESSPYVDTPVCKHDTLRPILQCRPGRPSVNELLAFDIGDDIVGIIDLRTDSYDCYRGARMADGARRILECDGVVISFNGILYDMPELANIARVTDALPLKGIHCDMRVHACRDMWPPRGEEDAPILGPDLRSHYQHYFGRPPPDPPDHLDDYARSNWRDCHMAGELWRRIIGRRAGKSSITSSPRRAT